MAGLFSGLRMLEVGSQQGPVLVHVCRAKVRWSSGCKSRRGKGRPGRVAIPATAEATRRSKPGRQEATQGRLREGRP